MVLHCIYHPLTLLLSWDWWVKLILKKPRKRNRGPRMTLKMSFNNVVQKCTHSDYFAHHKIFRVVGWTGLTYVLYGTSGFIVLPLHLCRRPTNGIFGIAPPSVDLFSCNCSMALTLTCSCNAAFWDNREASAMAMPSNVLLFFLSSEEVGIFLKDHLWDCSLQKFWSLFVL